MAPDRSAPALRGAELPRLRVLCPSTAAAEAEELERLFPQPAEVTICSGPTMPAALNRGVGSLAAPDPADILCFAHRDARLHFDVAAVLDRYLGILQRPGVLGFCGTKRQTREGHWYTSPPLYGGLVQGERALLFEEPRHGPPGLRYEPVETLDGYCLFMQRAAFDAIGGFDEELDGWHFYDIDVCMRALAAGFQNYVLDQPSTHLSWGRSDGEWVRLRGKWLSRWEAAGFWLLRDAEGEREPTDAERSFARGSGLIDEERWPEGVAELRAYLDLPTATDRLERATACLRIAAGYERLAAPREARRWLCRAVYEAADHREPHVALAEFLQRTGDLAGSYSSARAALELQERPDHALTEHRAWAEAPHDLVGVAAYYLGFVEESLRESLAAVEHNPWDQRLIDNYNLVQDLTVEHAPEGDPLVDVIVLSNAASEREYELTRRTIRSLRLSSADVAMRIVVVETNADVAAEPFADEPLFGVGVEVLCPSEPFGFNAFLRYGYEALPRPGAPSLLLLNNDVVLFNQGFVRRLLEGLGSLSSVSPLGLREATWSGIDRTEPVIRGYDINTVLHGWCVLLDARLLREIPFDELFPPEYTFYSQDEHYAAVLHERGLAHGLVTAAKALHLGRSSHHLLDRPAADTKPAGAVGGAPAATIGPRSCDHPPPLVRPSAAARATIRPRSCDHPPPLS